MVSQKGTARVERVDVCAGALVDQVTRVDTAVSETRALAGKRAAGQP